MDIAESAIMVVNNTISLVVETGISNYYCCLTEIIWTLCSIFNQNIFIVLLLVDDSMLTLFRLYLLWVVSGTICSLLVLSLECIEYIIIHLCISEISDFILSVLTRRGIVMQENHQSMSLLRRKKKFLFQCVIQTSQLLTAILYSNSLSNF